MYDSKVIIMRVMMMVRQAGPIAARIYALLSALRVIMMVRQAGPIVARIYALCLL